MAALRGAIGIEIVIVVYFFGNFEKCKNGMFG